jgi:hypothetical protein
VDGRVVALVSLACRTGRVERRATLRSRERVVVQKVGEGGAEKWARAQENVLC